MNSNATFMFLHIQRLEIKHANPRYLATVGHIGNVVNADSEGCVFLILKMGKDAVDVNVGIVEDTFKIQPDGLALPGCRQAKMLAVPRHISRQIRVANARIRSVVGLVDDLGRVRDKDRERKGMTLEQMELKLRAISMSISMLYGAFYRPLTKSWGASTISQLLSS